MVVTKTGTFPADQIFIQPPFAEAEVAKGSQVALTESTGMEG